MLGRCLSVLGLVVTGACSLGLPEAPDPPQRSPAALRSDRAVTPTPPVTVVDGGYAGSVDATRGGVACLPTLAANTAPPARGGVRACSDEDISCWYDPACFLEAICSDCLTTVPTGPAVLALCTNVSFCNVDRSARDQCLTAACAQCRTPDETTACRALAARSVCLALQSELESCEAIYRGACSSADTLTLEFLIAKESCGE